jgi:hypothetical protein
MGAEPLKTGEIFIVIFVAFIFVIGGIVVYKFMSKKD